MHLVELQEKLEKIVKRIEHKSTGSPKELAEELGVSERTIKRYISQMRTMGAKIKFCHSRNTYYFENPVSFHFGFKEETNLLETR